MIPSLPVAKLKPTGQWVTEYAPLIDYQAIGRGPGLVVMGGDSSSEGCGFESRHRIMDIFHIYIYVEKMFWYLFEKDWK